MSVFRWFWDAIIQIWRRASSRKTGVRTRLVSSGSSQDFLATSGLNPEVVSSYLRENPDVLEDHVMQQVDVELLERWIIRKTQRFKTNKDSDSHNGKIARKTSLSRWKFCVHADKRKMLQELTHSLHQKPNKAFVLWELGNCISSAVNADGYNLYVVDKNSQEISYFDRDMDDLNYYAVFTCKIETGSTVSAYVAKTREIVRVSNPDGDPRFPDGVPINKSEAKVIMCQPIIQSDGELLGVLELYRRNANGLIFHEEDEEIVNSYLVWGGIALHYAEMYYNMMRQKKLNDFLLNVVKSIFQDMVSMDTLIMKIMNFAQKLVSADRASLFLVDNKSKELYARIFDMGVGLEGETPDSNTTKEIRFPLGTGIAGQVAVTGEVLNIEDAYQDGRFNPLVDHKTGYRTKSILCMPIFIRGIIIGVVQMVNKQYGSFTKADEESFEVFASYCGLALHHAKLYDKIRRSEQKYKVALEMLSYHNTSTTQELDTICETPFPDNTLGVDDFYFATYHIDSDEKTRYSIYMFKELFGLTKFDLGSLIRFILTVRKNYRRVPYHNWTHGFTVANCVFAIIKKSTVFTDLERLSLFISCMCHDLDHRGKTNKFLLETASPLAAIYTTSTLEHHHFNQTVSILQQDGHNIFKCLSSDDYKTVLASIRHCILATDLALFFTNKTKVEAIFEKQAFDPTNYEHRCLLQAITMTACDLCASCKPWDQQVETVQVIFEEFYEQGDMERANGREPIPMMDRTRANQQASTQVGFLKNICIPCYELLSLLIPETKPMLDGCRKNLEIWLALQVEQEAEAKKLDV
ncbi:hypothetical protein CHUAL_007736 [Chamberlinius hualienensis]